MRQDNWPRFLDNAIQEARLLPFRWGEHDCVTWCANVVQALTGIDHMAELRGAYSNEEEAHALIREVGGALTQCVDARLERIPVPFARRGDVVMFEGALGLCSGLHSYFVTEAGLRPVKTLKCIAAWRVE